MILYFPSNISAKNYCNQIVYVNIIASRRWDVFLRNGVILAWVELDDHVYIMPSICTDCIKCYRVIEGGVKW